MFRLLNLGNHFNDSKLSPDSLIPGHFPTTLTVPKSEEVTGRTKTNEAGLIVTAELEAAIQRCRKKVRKIASECHKANRRFRDIEFDFLEDRERCLHGLLDGTEHTPTDALRVTQIFDDPQFFVEGATASDIAQGKLGNCWFLSALAVAATANLIEKICVERDEKIGIYGFIFWRDAGWVDVVIDDLLFLKIPRWQELTERERMLYKYDEDQYAKAARRGSKALYFSKSQTENETWVPLIEKAYAKLHGDYAALEGGYTNEAVEDLTGAVANLLYIQDILDPDKFWNEELMHANEDRAFGCSMPDSTRPGGEITSESSNGLVPGHAYSIIKAVEYNGKRFLKVRNPWGKFEWTGRWSDGSKEWSGEWLGALEALNYGFGNDGEFIMEYSDFLKTWDNVEKCRLFDSSWALSQLWLRVNCGDYPRPTNFGDVSFTFNLSSATTAVIVLAQLDNRYFIGLDSCYRFSLDFTLFKAGETEPIATSAHNSLFDRSVSLEADLEAGDYVVQVRIDRKLVKEKDAPISLDSFPATRKLAQKRAEQLMSSSIAANFNPSMYGPKMPLSSGLFTGMDLTTMEIMMHQLSLQHLRDKNAAFAPQSDHSKLAEHLAVSDIKAIASIEKVEQVNPPLDQGSSIVQARSEVVIAPTTMEEEGQKVDEESGNVVEKLVAGSLERSNQVLVMENIETSAMVIESPRSPGSPIQGWTGLQNGVTVSKVIHESYNCNGCGTTVVGSRFHCMNAMCIDYDLCESCVKTNAHSAAHRLIEITSPADGAKFDEQANDTAENNSVIVGLRVYTNRDSSAIIQGQLRHGEVIRAYLTMSKII